MSEDRAESADKVSRPDDWPESFSAPGRSCDHQMHWDSGDGLYKCIYCDNTLEAPA